MNQKELAEFIHDKIEECMIIYNKNAQYDNTTRFEVLPDLQKKVLLGVAKEILLKFEFIETDYKKCFDDNYIRKKCFTCENLDNCRDLLYQVTIESVNKK